MGREVSGSFLTANLSLLFCVYIAYLFYILTPTFIDSIGNIGTALLYGAFILAGVIGFTWKLYPSTTVLAIVTIAVLGLVLILSSAILSIVSNSLPIGSIGAQQGAQLNQIVNTGASAIGLSEVVIIVTVAGLFIVALFFFMNYSAGRFIESS